MALVLEAQTHAHAMARTQRLSHDGWVERLRRAGLPRGLENIAAGQRSPAEVVASWAQSPGHRDAMLEPTFRHAGIGVAQAADGTFYWCALFAGAS
jgi:uncharacterized protein YkwD